MAALNQTPNLSYLELTRLIALIYAFLYGKDLDTSELTIAGLTEHELPAFQEPEEEESEARSGNAIDYTGTFEGYLMECIREGDLHKLKRLLRTSNYSHIH